MKVLVVDDESPARRRLVRMLAKIPNVEVAGEAADGESALESISRLSPDLVLLDIRMPGLDGLSLARKGDLPPIVFTTAYAEHAVEAFELAAVDYLLKPIEAGRLAIAIDRARAASARLTPAALESIVQQALGKVAPRMRLAARNKGAVHLLDPRALTRLHASDKYTLVQQAGEELVLDDSLVELEAKLAPLGFVRVHRSELVNLEHVRSIVVDEGETWVELSDGQRAQVSRRLLPELRQKLGLA